MTRQANEDIFQRGLADGSRVNQSGRGFNELRNELMPARPLQAKGLIDFDRLNAELFAENLAEFCQVLGRERNHIPADLFFQSRGGIARQHPAAGHDGQAGAFVGFFH